MVEWKDTSLQGVSPSSLEPHALWHGDTRFYAPLTEPARASEGYADPELLHEHLGPSAHGELRGFPGGRVNVHPVYTVSTAHWDATVLLPALDGHPGGSHSLTRPVPQGTSTRPYV